MAPRIAEGAADTHNVYHRLLMPFYAENGIAELNPSKCFAWADRMVREGRVLLVDREGLIAGGLGMRTVPLQYSDRSLLGDEFYYVRQEYRGDSVGKELADAFEKIAERAGNVAILTVFNPKRAAGRGRFAQLFGWIPFGYQIRVI